VIFKYKSIFLVLALAMAASVVAQSQETAAAKRQALQMKAVQSAASLIEGTWTLKERFTPSGKPHAKPLEGTTVITLNPVPPVGPGKGLVTGVGVGHAGGSLRSTERGVMDNSQCVAQNGSGQQGLFVPAAFCQEPAAQGSQLFEIEATSKIDLAFTGTALVRGSTFSLTHTDLDIKGTYGVFRNGIHTAKVVNQFRVGALVANAAGAKTQRLSLVSGPRLNVPRVKETGPAAFGSLTDRSHQFKSLEIAGDTMTIVWGNGGKDIWVREKK
jgi:hypothetical protein